MALDKLAWRTGAYFPEFGGAAEAEPEFQAVDCD
jgi:hypothetical protein